MNWLLLIFLFLSGLAVGSFLNCVIYRLHTGESFLKGFSHCPHCRHKLNWRDLVPVLSFVFLKGKCRYCHQKISLQYPIIEISTAAIFLLIFNFQFSIWNQSLSLLVIAPQLSNQLQPYGESLSGSAIFNFLNLIYYWLISCFLIIIFVYDLKHLIIPDKVVYPAIAIVFFNNFLISGFRFQVSGFMINIYSALGAAGFFFLIWFFSKGKWLGFGDVKLVFLMGLLLGFPNILSAVFLAFFIGAIMGIGLIAAGKKKLSSQVPFGPFLVFGTFLSLFLGDNFIDLYLNLIL